LVGSIALVEDVDHQVVLLAVSVSATHALLDAPRIQRRS
jgi:hypothetical protein